MANNERQELEELRRIDELERKASGGKPKPKADDSSTLKDIGGHLSAGARGLSSELLGIPGALESMITPTSKGELKGQETIFPTPENIREGYSKIGWSEPEKKYQPSQTLGEIVPAVVGGTQLLKHGLGLGYDYLAPKIKSAFGVESKNAAKALQGSLAGDSSVLTSAIEKEKAAKQAAEKGLSQLKEQPTIAGRRAETQMPTPTGEASMLPVRQEVQSQVGKKVAQAKSELGQSETLKNLAEQNVETLDKELLSKPTMSKEEFGGKLRSILENIKNKYSPIRTREADFEGVFKKNAGTMLDTSDLIKTIYADKANAASRAERAFLDQIAEGSITPELGNANQVLGLKKADSLRKTLDKMIVGYEEKGDKGFAVDRGMAEKAKKYKSMLEAKFPQDYKTALKKWAEYSRPLDIVEQRIGSTVAPALEENTLSGESKLAEAQVVGAVIRKANEGHQVLSRMLQESPELKDAARLYFTEDLFGAKIAPTEKELARWIKDNGNALDQLGLRHEFQTMRDAKATAQQALDVAKGRFNQAAHDKQMASKLMFEAEKRTGAAERQMPEAKKIIADKAKRAEQAGKKLTGIVQSKEQSIHDLSNLESDILRGGKPSEIASKAEAAIKSLENNGHITPEQREQMLQSVQGLRGSIAEQQKAARILKWAGFGLASSAGMGYAGRHLGESILGN